MKNASIFEWIFNGFGLYFGSVFEWFFIYLLIAFLRLFFNVFYSCLDCFLNCVNPEIIEISLVLLGHFELDTFRRRSIFGQISDEFRYHFHIDFSLIFMTCSASNLALIFASIFHEKWPPK